jgi:hypothetical protein
MTMTVKLPPAMEQALRKHSSVCGRPASALMREALQAYLEVLPASGASAYDLGADLWGRHRGPKDLAIRRKAAVAEVWAEKHAARAKKPSRS